MQTSLTKDKSQSAPTSDDLLQLIHRVGRELNIRRESLRKLHLDSSFDTELGLDSLTRMEVFTRIEDYFGVSLLEEAYGHIETPRDLWREIRNASPQLQMKIAVDTFEIERESGEEIAYDAQTLIDVLDRHVQAHPDRTHITLYSDQDDGEKITYRELQTEAEVMAGGLQKLGVMPRQTVAIMLPTGRNYFVSFFAIMIAGGIPVPLYPPARRTQIEEHMRRHQRILDNCQAVMMITVDENKPLAEVLTTRLPLLQQIITPKEVAMTGGNLLTPKISAQDIAFLQYTSGSTGTPKGVVLTHFNLLANVHAMGERVHATSSDVYVSWLPLYHDMGLIGAWFGSLYYAMHLVVMPPLAFLARPSRWLTALHRYRGTLTGAPNFAYELCLQRISDSLLDELDLSSVRCIFNGAEPISSATLMRFNARFKRCGLAETAMQPVYGLAECSVGLTFPAVTRPPLIDRIDRDMFMKTGKAVPVTEKEDALQFPACGVPLAGHEIRVLDGSGLELPERQQGRLEFRGPSTTSGYFRNPEESRKLFHGDWLDSGDLAYIADGELYITGRIKDIIIHAGRNIYPHELEHAIGQIDGVRNGCVAVFGSQDPVSGTERLIILAETKVRDAAEREQLIVRINGIASDLIGSPADEVVLAEPHTVLKTSSGKIRRSACRELYEQGITEQSGSRNTHWLLARIYLISGISRLKRSFGMLKAWLYGLYTWILFLLSSLIAWPLVVICPRAWSLPLMRFTFRILTFACNTKVSIQGLENIDPEQGPFIFVCNHASYLDSMMLVLALPVKFSFVAKAELGRQFVAGTLLRKIDAQFVERFDIKQSISDSEMLITAAKAGRSLLFFPEGTFTRMPGLLPFRMGAFTTAAASGLPVVPIAIRGTRSLLRAQTWLPRKGAVTVSIGPVIKPETPGQGQDHETVWNVALKLKDAARTYILKHNGEPDLS